MRNSNEGYVFSKIYENAAGTMSTSWMDEVKNFNILFGNKNLQNCYNHGITYAFQSYSYSTVNLGTYYSIDSSFYERIYKNMGLSQGSVDSLSTFLVSLTNETFPEEQKAQEPNENVKAEEPKIEESKIEELKIEEPKIEEPKIEEPKIEETKKEELKQEEVKQEELKQEEVKQEEVKQEEVIQEQAKKEEEKKPENVSTFDFIGKGFPIDSLTLFGIDFTFFEALDEGTKEEVLKTEQKKYDERIAQETAAKEQASYNFEANGFPADALTLYSIEKEFFESLPDDLKKDALEQARTEYNKKEEEKKKSQEETEKNDVLIKKLKVLSILENAILSKLAKDKGITVKDELSEAQWSQLCTSINDLNEDTKNVLLKSLPYEVIKEFPEELRKAAKKLRRRYVEFYKKRTEPKENADSCSSSLLSINEQDINPTAGDIFESTIESEEPNKLQEEDQNILF